MFDDIRDSSNEAPCSHKILLSIDQEDVFDYEEGICQKFKTSDLVSSLLSEADEIHKNWEKIHVNKIA